MTIEFWIGRIKFRVYRSSRVIGPNKIGGWLLRMDDNDDSEFFESVPEMLAEFKGKLRPIELEHLHAICELLH